MLTTQRRISPTVPKTLSSIRNILLVWSFLGLLGMLPSQLHAQSIGHAVDTLYAQPGDTIQLSHPFIVPNSDSLLLPEGVVLSRDTLTYHLISTTGQWIAGRRLVRRGPYYFRYAYFQFPPKTTIGIRDREAIGDSIQIQADLLIDSTSIPASQRAFWETSGNIRKSGSLTRGFTVGNNRDVSVNSGLRLQLEGDLGDGLRIVGAITDDNIPIQPDGTTQQITDFDKVFLKLIKDPVAMTIGDYEVTEKRTRFNNYYRNVQGLQLAMVTDKSTVRVSGAVSKGKFNTNSFIGQEGVSGPYPLTGRNGEPFIIVLAGSERVYLNGQRMQRGQNQDYIINYNTSEITFSPKHVITSITRIVVDFEYNDQYYNRSLLIADASHKLLNDKLSVQVSYARDADNPNAPFVNETLYDLVRDSLAAAGDTTVAFTSGVVESGYQAGQIRYARRDTVVFGQTFSYFEQSENPDVAVFAITFSYLGERQGLYRRDATGNENIFEWVGPDEDGVPQGNYGPVSRWVLPNLLQVGDARISYQFNDHFRIFNETAMSSFLPNRLANPTAAGTPDLANLTGIELKQSQLSEKILLDFDLTHSYVGETFTNLDRVYQAEYNRVWDLQNPNERANENVIQTQAKIDFNRRLKLLVDAGYRHAGTDRNAWRQVYEVQSSMPKMLQGFARFTRIENRDRPINRDARWDRWEGDLFVPFGKVWRSGVVVWIEDKSEAGTLGDSTGSFEFYDLKPYIRTVNGRTFNMDLYYNYRLDREFAAGAIRDKSLAHTVYLEAAYTPGPRLSLKTITSFRDFTVSDSVFINQGLSNSRVINTQLVGRYQHVKRLIQANASYEVSAEQLARQEVRFVEVPAGQGQYVWLDSLYNNDGIQDIEEFQIANNPLIANYVKVIVPTQDFQPATRISFGGNLRLSFRQMVKRSKGFWNTLVRESGAATAFRLVQHQERSEGIDAFLINLNNAISDTSLLSASIQFRQDLYFFQNNKVGDLRLYYQNNQNKQYLVAGEELQTLAQWGITQRINLGNTRSLETQFRIGNKAVDSESFDTRNYDIDSWEINPQFNLQFSRKFRASGGYAYDNRRNFNLQGQEESSVQMHKLIFEGKWNIKDRNNLFGKVELVNVQKVGESNVSAEYELLQGLRDGGNAIWQLFATYYLMQNLEFSVTYDGRASISTPTIHTGRIQVRAFF
ncbi:hypothetical protein [Pontibacter sp. G13]|uniref:hypothetical protein n=1 Tax=Pontibacter sp. G13 TaxID=3074898 RepID=UPI00288AB0C9|nr:hypothetical protein [Pontibacter sp. G13]WNJ20387.1 hypothetical protein RJD25_07890 [Pontibacter sp. G13]